MLIEECASAGAKAFEWQQEVGLNQARRTGEVADVDSLFKFALEAGDAEAGSAPANGMPMAALTSNEEAVSGKFSLIDVWFFA